MRAFWLATGVALLAGGVVASLLHLGQAQVKVYVPKALATVAAPLTGLDAAGDESVAVQPPAGMSLMIPAIAVNTPVDRLGTNAKGDLQAPASWDHAGWYEGSPQPGQPGVALFMGHVDSHTGPAVFFRLRQVSAGDEIDVVDNGQPHVFHVASLVAYPESAVPMAELLKSSGPSRIALVTCAGDFVTSVGRYDERLIVFGDA